MDNNKNFEELIRKMSKLIDEIGRTNDKLESLKYSVENSSSKGTILGVFILFGICYCLGVILYSQNNSKYDKAIIYTDDNAVIFDVGNSDDIYISNSNVIYVDEDKGISANDIAISLVGEDGTVYYYNSDTKEKTLINQK